MEQKVTENKCSFFKPPPPYMPDSDLAKKDSYGNYLTFVPVTIDDDNWETVEEIENNGEELLEAGRYDEALICFQNVAAKRVNQENDWRLPHTLLNWASTLACLGKFDEAFAMLNNAAQSKGRPWCLIDIKRKNFLRDKDEWEKINQQENLSEQLKT
jgi:tetratricopeptide (TPR) repeat protein